MTNITTLNEINQQEERLRIAMLAGDVQALDALIDDRLIFIGPDGGVYGKQDDLDLHRSGQQKITKVAPGEVRIELYGEAAISTVQAKLAGTFKGQAFEGNYRYIRTWLRTDRGWRIVGGSVCAVPPTSPKI